MADKKEEEKPKQPATPKAKPDAAKVEKAKAAAKGPKVEGGEQVKPKLIRLRDKYRGCRAGAEGEVQLQECPAVPAHQGA
jgi:hypothetical protein